MARRLDHEKATRARRGEEAERPKFGTVSKAKRDAAKIAARARPSVDEMFDDVRAIMSGGRKPDATSG